jgi:phosphotriesterase-related protein
VLGDVEPSSLGHTQPHEHVLCDMSSLLQPSNLWAVHANSPVRDLPASQRARIFEPVRLDNREYIKRTGLNIDSMRLNSESDAIAELQLYRASGGGAVVDSTCGGMARDPLGLARVSRMSGIHIVMGSGYYTRDYQPTRVLGMSIEDIREEIVSDICDGAGDTGIRSGLIGEVGLSWPVHPEEEKVLRAACGAQVATGAPLQIHPGRNRDAPFHAIELVKDADGRPERTIICHLDRTFERIDELLALAETSCYVELDLFGQESSHSSYHDMRRPNDATRIEWVKALLDAGFGSRLLISQDTGTKVDLQRYGGAGYAHILDNVMPLMRRMGLADDDLELITVTNPAQVLTLSAPLHRSAALADTPSKRGAAPAVR